MNSLIDFLKKYSWVGLLRLVGYPITSLITTPIRLGQTLWSSRVLADGRWGHYPHFLPHTAINSLFYWTRAISLYRFGRSGCAPYLSLGDAKLSQLFFYSLPSLYMYWLAGAPTVLFGMFGWLITHLIWVKIVSPWHVLPIVVLALISTTFYSNVALQNYNVIGWLFFPLALYGMISGDWLLAGLAWIGAQFGGITVVFLGAILSLAVSLMTWSWLPVLAILPAGLMLLSHLWPLIYQGSFIESLLTVSKAIGLTEQKAKYRYTFTKQFRLPQVYRALLYIQFIIVFFLLNDNLPGLFLVGLLIFAVNTALFRFADYQSIDMLMFSLASGAAILGFHPLLIPSYWLLISPLARAMGFPMKHRPIDIVPVLSPFDVKLLIEGMEGFLEPVRKGQRVLMTFDDPNDVYENIFDGQRVLLELPLYVAAVKEVHYMPDFWGVFALNYHGAPHFWGRNVNEVLVKVDEWRTDFVVVYQDSSTQLDTKWQKSGFEPMGKFSWANFAECFGASIGDYPLPDWWLLKAPTHRSVPLMTPSLTIQSRRRE